MTSPHFWLGVVMCLHNSPGNNKSRHLKQVTASLKSNILLCLESKGFEFLSAIHLSLMKHLLQFDLFQYDFSVWKRMKKSDWKPQNPWSYGAFPVCRNYTVRAQLCKPVTGQWRSSKTDPGLVGTLGFQYNRKHLCTFGLFIKDILRTGHGGRNVFAGRWRISE